MATTQDRLIERQDDDRRGGPVAAATLIPHGTLCFINATGYLSNATATGANLLGGVATQRADNSGGADGDIDVDYFTRGSFEFTSSGLTQADVGKKVYAVDNDTVSLTSTNNTYIGTLATVLSATSCMVNLDDQNPT